jgi:gliding motility-associated-like protein
VGGCASPASANIVINAQPPTPQIPATGIITTPTCSNPEGRVVLNGLPSSGRWTVNSVPAGISQSGNGTSATIRGLSAGSSYVFTVTNSDGCVSGTSASVAIPQVPNAPVMIITNPPPVCFPATVDLTAASITAGSTAGLTFTYWTNPAATVPYGTPERATNGTYYIKGINQAECSDIEAVIITVRQSPVADAGSDQNLNYAFSSLLSANQPLTGETGAWSIFTGAGLITDASSARTTVTELGIGENIFLWTVSNEVCTPAVDTLKITVRDLVVPTLITPNEDGRNDYFRMEGIEMLTGNELVIFDRRGIVVYRNNDYKNDWNGIDYNDKPLPPDTYFFIFKSGNGRSRSGYVVIRR